MDACLAEKWYALQTYARAELSVSAQLSNAGVRVFLPMQSARLAHRASQVATPQPLFPRYLFCRMSLSSGPRLYSISGFVRIVGAGKRPMPIDDAEIDAVRRFSLSSYPIEPISFPRAGDRVQITSGPFAGMSGSLVVSGDMRRFVVSISLLNRAVAVTLPKDWITSSMCDAYSPLSVMQPSHA